MNARVFITIPQQKCIEKAISVKKALQVRSVSHIEHNSQQQQAKPANDIDFLFIEY